MSQPVNGQFNNYAGTPMYNYAGGEAYSSVPAQPVNPVPQQNGNVPIYQYPTASLYQPAGQASGVNIIINNPSGYSAGGAANGASYPYPYPCPYPYPYPYPTNNGNVQPQIINNIPGQPSPVVNVNTPEQPVPAVNINTPEQPAANTPVAPLTTTSPTGRTKRITQITDEYIKTLEDNLRNPSKTVRQQAIAQIIKLCEETTDRYDNPAIIALINIALQDSDAGNRIYAMTPLTTGSLGGDDNTIKLLTNLTSSDKKFGQEAEMANEALIALSRSTIEVPDYSVPKQRT